MAWYVPRRLPSYGRHVFRKNKAYLAGLPTDLVTEQAARFVEALPAADWIPGSLEALRGHRERGESVVLMSGTLQPIIDALAAHVGADAAIGTLAHTEAHTDAPSEGRRYTGQPPQRHPFYHAKADLLNDICEAHGVTAADVAAYADSRFDIPLLERVGEPVAVGPDRALDAWARERGCRFIEYRQSVPGGVL